MKWHSFEEDPSAPLGPGFEPRVINCRCLPLGPQLGPQLGPHLVEPSPRVDRDVADISHEWRMRANIRAYAIDAGPPKEKRKR